MNIEVTRQDWKNGYVGFQQGNQTCHMTLPPVYFGGRGVTWNPFWKDLDGKVYFSLKE